MKITKSELKEMIEETVKDVLNNHYKLDENCLFEHKNDLKPIVCIIMGGPGVGKTYWMKKIADDFLWQQFKQLDIDHTLQKYQLETCNDVAMALITSLSGHSVFSENTKQNFESVRENIQNLLNERTDKVGSFGMYIDISKINLNSKIGNSTLWEWAKRMDKITKRDYRDEFLRKFKKEFYKTFFKSIFASDFSKRDRASQEYDQTLYTKLGNDIFNNNNSTCIAITGKSINDIDWIISAVKHTDSVISVVFLDGTLELAVSQDMRRDRTVGREFIENTMVSIKETWKVLTETYENKGIWKLFHIIPQVNELNNKIAGYDTKEVLTNRTMLYSKNQ